MKRIKTLALALACIMLLTLSLTSCSALKDAFFDEDGNFVWFNNFFRDGNETENPDIQVGELIDTSAYELEYVSNGDGTCTAFIKMNQNQVSITISKQIVRYTSTKSSAASSSNEVIVINPSQDVSGFHAGSVTVEIPSTSPDGDTVIAVGDSEFLMYPNVPRIMDKEVFEDLLNKLKSSTSNETEGEFRYNQVASFYTLQDPSAISDSEKINKMYNDYPVTRVTPVYVLKRDISTYLLKELSQFLEQNAEFTASDALNCFISLKGKVEQEDSNIAKTLEFGNSADKITKVILPNTVVKIAPNAFAGCHNMEYIEIGNNVAEIGESAFYGCESLKSINIPYATTYIGAGAFYDCVSLTSANVACTDGWIRTYYIDGRKETTETENFSFSVSATNASNLVLGDEYKRISK